MLRIQSQILIIVVVFALAIVCARAVIPHASATHAALGNGAPIVLVHGLGGSSNDWLPTAQRLARRHRVVLVDLPGHGPSQMPAAFSLESAEASLDRAIAEIPGGPVILVGHSLGGLIAAAEASDHPEHVRGLVLVEAALRSQIPEDQRAAWLDRLDADYDGVVREAYLSFGRDSAQGKRLYRRAAMLDPRMMKRWIRLACSEDVTERATRLTVPVLAILAERSWPANESWASVAETLGYADVPRLRAKRVEQCGHFIMLDRPEQLAALIQAFAADPEGLRVAMR